MDIKCRKTLCKFNEGFVCQAKHIIVDKKHVCKTYEEGGQKADDTTKKIFFEKVEYAPFRHCLNMDINCQENCLFNQDGKCQANGILINVQKEIPKCNTYLGKWLVK